MSRVNIPPSLYIRVPKIYISTCIEKLSQNGKVLSIKHRSNQQNVVIANERERERVTERNINCITHTVKSGFTLCSC